MSRRGRNRSDDADAYRELIDPEAAKSQRFRIRFVAFASALSAFS